MTPCCCKSLLNRREDQDLYGVPGLSRDEAFQIPSIQKGRSIDGDGIGFEVDGHVSNPSQEGNSKRDWRDLATCGQLRFKPLPDERKIKTRSCRPSATSHGDCFKPFHSEGKINGEEGLPSHRLQDVSNPSIQKGRSSNYTTMPPRRSMACFKSLLRGKIRQN